MAFGRALWQIVRKYPCICRVTVSKLQYAYRCPFAQRAWLTLEELGVPYDHKLADPANKPKEFTDLYASIVQNTDDSAKVPTIIGAQQDQAAS